MVPEPTPFGDGTAPIGNVHPNAAGYAAITDQLIAVPTPSAFAAGLLVLALLASRRRGVDAA